MTNPRIHVTFGEEAVNALVVIANNENKSLSNLVKELTLEALELREDQYFSKLADNISNNTIEYFSHEEAWK